MEQAAQETQATPEELLAEALRRYLWELSRRKIAEESKAYRRQHADLKTRYLGQYIAMLKGEVVDHDADFQALWQRVRQRFGRTPVLITQVREEPETTLARRGFQQRNEGWHETPL
jgi:glutamyl-tRNA reductase